MEEGKSDVPENLFKTHQEVLDFPVLVKVLVTV